MIVNTTNQGWEIFFHSAHGLLAGKIANRLNKKYKNDHWVATLAAIIEHDDRQLNFGEKNYLTEIGTPKDFLQDNRNSNEILKRSKRLLEESDKKSRLISILIIHHLQFIHEEIAKDNKSIMNFLKKLELQKQSYMKIYNIHNKEIDKIYQTMVFADRSSLILCQNALPTKNRKLEINKSIDGKTYFITVNEQNEINIDPWIFQQSEFKLSAEYKLLEKSSFSSNKQFETFLKKTPIKIREWKFVKGDN